MDMNLCIAEQVAVEDHQLERYLEAARERYSDDQAVVDLLLQLIQQRTHQIWSDFLTYMDSTPPILPKPE